MAHINIAKLFPQSSKNIMYSSCALDIDTLTKQFNNEKMCKINLSQLTKVKQNQQKHIQNTYIKQYNACCDQILNANSLSLTDIIFETTEFVIGCPGYNPSECIDFIYSNLQEHSISCFKIDSNKIFVTWHTQ